MQALDFVIQKGSVSLSDVAAELDVDPSSAYRILKAIETAGYIRSMNRKYSPGYRIAELICFEKSEVDVCNAAKPIMKSLTSRIDGCAHLCMLTETGTEFLSQEFSSGVIHVIQPIGQVEPLHCTASGKASLAFLPDAMRERMIRSPAMRFTPYTDYTITDPEKLIKELDEVRTRGYALDLEEYHYNVCCISAPVFDRMNISRYSLGISCVYKTSVKTENIENYSYLIIHAAEKLSAYLKNTKKV